MTTGKTIALTIWTFVGKIMSLLFNTLSRCFTALLPRSSCLLISWLQSLSTVILEPKKTKSVTVSLVYPSLCHEVMGQDAMVFIFWMLSFKPAFSLYILHISYKIFGTLFLFTKIFGYICTTYMCMLSHFSCIPTLCDPLHCSPGSSVHGIFQGRILGWIAMPSSRGSSQPRDKTWAFYVSCIGRLVLYH